MFFIGLTKKAIMFFGAYQNSVVYFHFYFSSVLKILGELDSGSASQIVKDFSMETHQNNTVSVTAYLPAMFCSHCRLIMSLYHMFTLTLL